MLVSSEMPIVGGAASARAGGAGHVAAAQIARRTVRHIVERTVRLAIADHVIGTCGGRAHPGWTKFLIVATRFPGTGRTCLEAIGGDRQTPLHPMRSSVASRIMPRTTLDLDASVLRDLRRLGAQEGKSMGRLASELLARSLADHAPEEGPASVTWVSRDLGAPRVHLEDKEALRDALDERP